MASTSTPKTPTDPILIALVQALARRQARIDVAEEAAALAVAPAGDNLNANCDGTSRDQHGA